MEKCLENWEEFIVADMMITFVVFWGWLSRIFFNAINVKSISKDL